MKKTRDNKSKRVKTTTGSELNMSELIERHVRSPATRADLPIDIVESATSTDTAEQSLELVDTCEFYIKASECFTESEYVASKELDDGSKLFGIVHSLPTVQADGKYDARGTWAGRVKYHVTVINETKEQIKVIANSPRSQELARSNIVRRVYYDETQIMEGEQATFKVVYDQSRDLDLPVMDQKEVNNKTENFVSLIHMALIKPDIESQTGLETVDAKSVVRVIVNAYYDVDRKMVMPLKVELVTQREYFGMMRLNSFLNFLAVVGVMTSATGKGLVVQSSKSPDVRVLKVSSIDKVVLLAAVRNQKEGDFLITPTFNFKSKSLWRARHRAENGDLVWVLQETNKIYSYENDYRAMSPTEVKDFTGEEFFYLSPDTYFNHIRAEDVVVREARFLGGLITAITTAVKVGKVIVPAVKTAVKVVKQKKK